MKINQCFAQSQKLSQTQTKSIKIKAFLPCLSSHSYKFPEKQGSVKTH
jgi:hypothetical protein